MQAQAIHPSGGTADGRSPAKARGPGEAGRRPAGPFLPGRSTSCSARSRASPEGGEKRMEAR